MPKEKEGYRDNLESIYQQFPDREMLRPIDIQNYTGWCYRTVKKRIKFKSYGLVSREDLARQISV